MGHACPVCKEAQVDAVHLANHLAFTAILRGGTHEEWLDEHVPEWNELGPEELGPLVVEHAESVDLDLPEEEATKGSDRPRRPARSPAATDRLSEEDRAILEEARELTRRMLEGDKPGESTQNAEGEEEGKR